MPYIGNAVSKASQTRRFDVTGSTSATHTLSWVAPNEQSLIVTINGVKQHEDAYSVSGTTLTLTSALVAADKLEVVGIIDVGTTDTPAQDSVNLDQLATTGTASSSTFLRGDMAWTAVSDTSGLASVQTFTSSGTWTRSSGVTKVVMEIQGAGGGSGNGDWPYNVGGAGGAGGYAKKFLDVSSVSTSTITVGSGGVGSAGAGTNGGNTSWADGTNTVTGNGGSGGGASASNSSNGAGGAGGSASGGDINIAGQTGIGLGGWNPDVTQAKSVMSIGGSSVLGFGGSGIGSGNDGIQGVGYGSGGSGSGYPPYDNPGVAGQDGIVIVWEYK